MCVNPYISIAQLKKKRTDFSCRVLRYDFVGIVGRLFISNGMVDESEEIITLSKISWKELEKLLRKSLNTDARFGPKRRIRRIGENGFLSVCCIVSPDWIGDDDPPNHVVFKFCCYEGMRALDRTLEDRRTKITDTIGRKMLYQTHNTETAFYRSISTAQAEYLKIPKTFILRGKQLYMSIKLPDMEKDDKSAFILMEYVQNAVSLHLHDTLSFNEADQVLQFFAKLQGMAEEKKMFDDEQFDWNPWKCSAQIILTEDAMKKTIDELPLHYGSEFAGPSSGLSRILDTVYCVDEMPDTYPPDALRSFCHGDLWPSNIMWRGSVPGNRQLAAVVDFQWAHIGRPTEDLIFFLCSNLSGSDRRRYTQELLARFYSYLTKEMGQMPYTAAQLTDDYRSSFPPIGIILLARMAVIFRYTCLEVPAETEADISCKAERVRIMREKLLCLAEDILTYNSVCAINS